MQLNALLNPLKLSAAIGLVGFLAGCSGNSSSTTSGPAPIIEPIEVDKEIAVVDWDQNNEVEMASYAYRGIARHSMLATLYSGHSAVFTSFINLVKGSRDRNCNVSGSIDAVLMDAECKNISDEVVSCTVEEDGVEVANPDVVLTTTEQSSIFYQCQDGVTSGSYFNGPLRVVLQDDVSVEDIYKNTTTISAVAEVSAQGEDGKFLLNEDGEVIKEPATDFLMQNEINTFFMAHEYNLVTTYDIASDRLTSRDISDCTTADETVDGVFKQGTSIVIQEVLETGFVAGLQEPSPQFPYTEFTDLDLIAAKDNFRCEDVDGNGDNGNESLRFDTNYSLATKIESKALGENTQFDWTDLLIPTDQKDVEGIITLTHTNQDAVNYVVTVIFDGNGGLTVNGGPQMTVQEFIDLSKAEEAAE
jgi:hypothetical protein